MFKKKNSKPKVPRRPAGFWQPFNDWWRLQLDTLGRRPVTTEVQRWYNETSVTAWAPDERPTWKDTRIHAKCLRSTEAVKEYFRKYRATKKTVKEPESGSESDEEHDQPAQPDDIMEYLRAHNETVARRESMGTSIQQGAGALNKTGSTLLERSGSAAINRTASFQGTLLHQCSMGPAQEGFNSTVPLGHTKSFNPATITTGIVNKSWEAEVDEQDSDSTPLGRNHSTAFIAHADITQQAFTASNSSRRASYVGPNMQVDVSGIPMFSIQALQTDQGLGSRSGSLQRQTSNLSREASNVSFFPGGNMFPTSNSRIEVTPDQLGRMFMRNNSSIGSAHPSSIPTPTSANNHMAPPASASFLRSTSLPSNFNPQQLPKSTSGHMAAAKRPSEPYSAVYNDQASMMAKRAHLMLYPGPEADALEPSSADASGHMPTVFSNMHPWKLTNLGDDNNMYMRTSSGHRSSSIRIGMAEGMIVEDAEGEMEY